MKEKKEERTMQFVTNLIVQFAAALVALVVVVVVAAALKVKC